ncbi:NADH-quinone oxidoreductase subunit NuoH [Salipaludibacillus agaradhaerens]|uniref:NADH-quinone oxidoreductase subunit H n=1 Tax=Salipaludibacillus agaradhaerens TaxID=76935 RepID=A0A9Q4B583_SALAG|nr:NADH-quinone oxidoreductase subunit NuoH [Salipaludibacillus agaradhaerens]UJW59265.1 NADH-quinone oxidoreductase subunit NuoH [Bacillus sp. A116_S68]MCR6098544.1 NADH-quinone oxidoreductase subunit NuoH [Salipaludibacillus agaradhaerens]MCR6108219.1 NADH-quinone oxidoreductase subunit NuoH [Salipaludibacillus agaradhaerens]MCR6115551.1 NADH-quinone oxidoreductase subunit NuoH [Salipaludibacillus agaradhaerens]MCR6120244.1 NADH-quinone oxidoreductase subunit NuoH [Salipaludibacillus agaradh
MDYLLMFLYAVAVLIVLLGGVTFAILAERKVIGYIQLRPGPNRHGPWGTAQTIADVVKLLLKEDIIPAKADKKIFVLAPVLAFAPAFSVMAVLVYSSSIGGADINIGVLYFLGVSSITMLGVLMGGWSSNNKYALLGSIRGVAQMVSYELPLILSIVGIIILVGSLNMTDIVNYQADMGMWFIVPQFLAFIVYMISSIAELNRSPFDLPEAESELVAGYFTEYSGFRFAMFMLAEYTYAIAIAGLATTLFLGGWLGPAFLPGIVWFLLKVCAVMFIWFWLTATLPRARVDQLMNFGWKVLIPLALLNIVVTSIIKVWMG